MPDYTGFVYRKKHRIVPDYEKLPDPSLWPKPNKTFEPPPEKQCLKSLTDNNNDEM